jgi:hypothetical protein
LESLTIRESAWIIIDMEKAGRDFQMALSTKVAMSKATRTDRASTDIQMAVSITVIGLKARRTASAS